MRSAIISDIHGNLVALRAVLADVAAGECGRIVCLGDLVEGGPSDVEVIRALMERGVVAVRGRRDEVVVRPPGSEEEAFLRGLPPSIVEAGIVYTHVSPRARPRRISDRFEAWNVFEEAPHRVAFVGHAHIPMIFSQRGGSAGAAKPERFDYGRPVRLDPADRYIVCVGAVGYGRDGINAPRYAVYDDERGTVEIRRAEGPVPDL